MRRKDHLARQPRLHHSRRDAGRFRLPAGHRISGSAGDDPARERPARIPHAAGRGRLRPGVTVAEARGAMGILAGRLERAYPQTNQSRTVAILPLRELANQITDRFVLTLAGSAGFVLLLACANVASLMLARATSRQGNLRWNPPSGPAGPGRPPAIRGERPHRLMGGLLGIWLAPGICTCRSRASHPRCCVSWLECAHAYRCGSRRVHPGDVDPRRVPVRPSGGLAGPPQKRRQRPCRGAEGRRPRPDLGPARSRARVPWLRLK